VIGKQMGYYNNERRHSRLGYRSPMEYLINEGFIPETLAENGVKSGSASGAQALVLQKGNVAPMTIGSISPKAVPASTGLGSTATWMFLFFLHLPVIHGTG